MRPAPCLQDRPGLASRLVELVVAAIRIGLKDAGVTGQMCLRMLPGPVARVIEHCRRRCPAAKWLIIAHIDPTSPGGGLALGKHRNRRVVPMQPLACKDMRFNPLEERLVHRPTSPSLGSQG